MLKNIYYVYIYKTPDGTPFYIGKGKGQRLYVHIAETKNRHKIKKGSRVNIKKLDMIESILNDGQFPIIEKIDENLSETKALKLEKKLIKEIGRLDLGTGPLLNLTDGGEGISGNVCSEERKRKISSAITGIKRSEETKNKLRNKKRSIEQKKAMSER